ncbi:MAG: hypothetical protein IT288_15030 [Bdellovibrionales bacterium]|nr:hypothetical protein [Bdellovibrionales bacterium]
MTAMWIAFWIFSGFIGALHVYHIALVWKGWVRFLREANHRDQSVTSAIRELMNFIAEYRAVSPSLEDVVRDMKDHFLKDAVEIYLSGALRGHEFLKALRNRQQSEYKVDLEVQDQWTWISRVTPAVAWVAAIGSVMVVFDQGLGQHTALVIGKVVLGAVFYCVVFSFLLVEPLRRWQHAHARSEWEKNEALVLGIGMLLRDRDALEILEAINAQVDHPEKVEWDEAFGTRRKYLEGVS